MKKILDRFKKAITVSTIFLFMVPAICFSAEYVSVKGETVNVRTGPSKNNPIYMELFDGYPLQVIGKNGNWLKVKDYESDVGWVFGTLTKPLDTVIVTKNKINMRSTPSTKKQNIVANIEKGVVLKRIGKKGNWVNVRHDSGVEGWIYAPLLWPNI